MRRGDSAHLRNVADKARHALAAGHSVIVDAVFAQADQRQAIAAVGDAAQVAFHGVFLSADSQRGLRGSVRAPTTPPMPMQRLRTAGRLCARDNELDRDRRIRNARANAGADEIGFDIRLITDILPPLKASSMRGAPTIGRPTVISC